ncbi:MAG: DUF6787 family protein [Fulvivirga sp.]
MNKPNWIGKLERKWNVSTVQVFIILIVFACTGFTVMFLKNPILDLIMPEGDRNWVFTFLYYLFILPVYNIILLIYGFIFGQFRFFWEFEKRMLRRMSGRK